MYIYLPLFFFSPKSNSPLSCQTLVTMDLEFDHADSSDYQGRSWIAPPKDAKARGDRCSAPTRLAHTWSAHKGGAHAIRFFPNHGHLLLSAGMDAKVKIWDVFNSRNCMRTYRGHTRSVRDICFSNDGSKFLSCGYDNNIKYWDTETGQAISTFSTGNVPHVVKLNPDEDKQNVLLAGMSDNRIVQWDINTGQITQEYIQHLGAVNSITFLDNNRRFVSSSDDKSLCVWEYGDPAVIQHIGGPLMRSMPSVALHPNLEWVACQSTDRRILAYKTIEGRLQFHERKVFSGHRGGPCCKVNFSPDGRFVMSGDNDGWCWFWDSEFCTVSTTVQCHLGAVICVEWQPLEQSKVATCGSDGFIAYLD